MIKEIYCKLPTDLDYEAKVESIDESYNILLQVKVVLGTKPGEVLGNPMFGVDLEKYLFLRNYNKEEIMTMLRTEISANVYYNPNKWNLDVDISFGHNVNDTYEYAVIDIILNLKKCLGIIVNQQ